MATLWKRPVAGRVAVRVEPVGLSPGDCSR